MGKGDRVVIQLYSGTPGSGKSLHVAERVYLSLKYGRTVICNFDVNLEKIKKVRGKYIYLDNVDITPEKLMEIGTQHVREHGRKEDSLLLVIDECQILFNSREWQSGGRAKWLTFFTQHRKFNYEIVLIAQFDGMIDKQIRSLIEYEVIHRKVSNFGLVGKIMSLVAVGKLFCAVRMWYPLKERLDAEWFVYRPKYAAIYDTFGIFSDPNK